MPNYYKPEYTTLNKETSYNCGADSKCSCTTLYGRTNYDKMMYNWIINGTKPSFNNTTATYNK